ncbi:MAG: EthD domain-containing protein [Nevskia sp.]|nr:EthD domain-containing protein [Nevskia sp.]
MISLNWVMVLPAGMSAEQFDQWYLGVHTRYGKASQGIVRYVVNRALAAQPAAACGAVYRVAQEYWNDWAAMEACWNSPSGHAVLGDGLANIGLDPGTIPAVALTADRRFDVAQPANFSTVGRGYRSRADGTVVKFLAYGMSARRDSMAQWYAERFAGLGQDPRVREHVFGTTVGKTLRIGALASLPGAGQKSYDWLLELWFDDRAGAAAFLDSAVFRSTWSALQEASGETLAALFRGQEMLVVMDPTPHRDD